MHSFTLARDSSSQTLGDALKRVARYSQITNEALVVGYRETRWTGPTPPVAVSRLSHAAKVAAIQHGDAGLEHGMDGAMDSASPVDDPSRIGKSKAVGALFGLTPKKYQSGEKDVTGGITRAGDEMVRTALYEAANVLLSRITRFSKLKRGGMDVAKRRGSKRAKVALARKIGVILHRMWIDGTTYRWAETKPIAAQG